MRERFPQSCLFLQIEKKKQTVNHHPSKSIIPEPTYWFSDAPVLERQIRQYGAIDEFPRQLKAHIQGRTAAGGGFDGHPLALLGRFVLVVILAVRGMSLAHALMIPTE